MEFKNEIELRIKIKSNEDDLDKKLATFNDIFRFAFKDYIEKSEIESLCTILKVDGIDINK